MSRKIKNYVDGLFYDIPSSKKSEEIKEELIANLIDRYNEYLAEGKTESQSFTLAVSSMGDVDELLKELEVVSNDKEKKLYYEKRKGIHIAIAVFLYITAVITVIIFGDKYETLAPAGLLLIVAIATSLLIYSHYSTPIEYRGDAQKTPREIKSEKKMELITSIYWLSVVLIYLCISFIFRIWQFSWMIFPIAGISYAIIETLIKLRDE